MAPGVDDLAGIAADGAIASEEVGRAVEPTSDTAEVITDDPLFLAPDGRSTVSAERAINGGTEFRGYEFVNPPDPPSVIERETISTVLLSPLDDAASNTTA